MKRLMYLALCLFLIAGTFGCSPRAVEVQEEVSAPVNAPAETQNRLSGEITFATWGSLDEKIVNERIIEAFEKEYPGVKVNLEYIPNAGDYWTKMDTMFLGGNAPDVLYGHPYNFANWASKGLLMDLEPYFAQNADFFYNKDEFTVEMYDAFKWNGKHIATINGHDTFLLFYNKDMFDEAGVPYPTDDWTWDDFVEAGKKLTIAEGPNKQFGFTVPGWSYPSLAIVKSFGGSLFDDLNNPQVVTFDSPETVAGLQFVQDLIHTHKIAPTAQDTETLGGSFDTGKVAMDITGMWAVVNRKNITDFKWDIANMPLAPGKPRQTIAFFAGYAVNKNTSNPDLAWEFAKYFQSDTAQSILAGLGLITVINHRIASSDEVIKGEGMPDHHILRVTSIDYAPGGHPYLTNLDEINSKAIQPSFDQLIANTIDPATAANNIHSETEKLFAESGKQQ
jgi:multiple sugar transport system substrate-binding protein